MGASETRQRKFAPRPVAFVPSSASGGGVPNFNCEIGSDRLRRQAVHKPLVFLTGEDEGGGQRHIDMGESRVWTLDRARPEPSDDSEFLADEWLEVGPFAGHFRGYFDRRIEMADAFLGLSSHPRSIAAHVFRETGCTGHSFAKSSRSLRCSGQMAPPERARRTLGGISIIALLMSTATGLRSEA